MILERKREGRKEEGRRRGGERKREREHNIYWLPPGRTPTGDRPRNPGPGP